MSMIAHMLCQDCGASHQVATPWHRWHRVSATACPCGGKRQVVRVVRDPRAEVSASPVELERNVQARASDETLTP